MAKRQFISTRILKEGMIIDQPITDVTGRVMIKRGVYLDAFQISYLQERGINGVYITDTLVSEEEKKKPQEEKKIVIPDHTKKVIARERVEDPQKVALSANVKERVGEGIQYLFNNTDSESFIEETHNIAKELTDAIFENSAVAVDISMLKVSDEYTFKHSVDVATMSMIIAKKYGLDKEQVKEIGVAGLLHDVGKSKIPPEILNKPGRLNDREFQLMKHHSLYGYNILKEKEAGFSKGILAGVLQHHEKINGKGYPMSVDDSQIHLYAKLIACADIFDALVTDRPYKEAFPKREAVEMIMSMTGELDIKAIEAFLGAVILYPVDSIITLSDGRQAKVVSNDPKYVLRPKVVVIESGEVLDLANDMACANLIIE